MTYQYTFTTDQGWRVTQCRPFSLGYTLRDTPGLSQYSQRPHRLEQENDMSAAPTLESAVAGMPEDLLAILTSQKLNFDYLTWDVVRRMIEERINIRDKNRKDIMGRITDLSGDIYRCHIIKTPDSSRQKATLEKTKLDLEKQAREEDVALWKDLTDLRKEILANQRQYQSTKMRQSLVTGVPLHDGDKTQRHPVGAGYLPGAQPYNRT